VGLDSGLKAGTDPFFKKFSLTSSWRKGKLASSKVERLEKEGSLSLGHLGTNVKAKDNISKEIEFKFGNQLRVSSKWQFLISGMKKILMAEAFSWEWGKILGRYPVEEWTLWTKC